MHNAKNVSATRRTATALDNAQVMLQNNAHHCASLRRRTSSYKSQAGAARAAGRSARCRLIREAERKTIAKVRHAPTFRVNVVPAFLQGEPRRTVREMVSEGDTDGDDRDVPAICKVARHHRRPANHSLADRRARGVDTTVGRTVAHLLRRRRHERSSPMYIIRREADGARISCIADVVIGRSVGGACDLTGSQTAAAIGRSVCRPLASSPVSRAPAGCLKFDACIIHQSYTCVLRREHGRGARVHCGDPPTRGPVYAGMSERKMLTLCKTGTIHTSYPRGAHVSDHTKVTRLSRGSHQFPLPLPRPIG